MKNSTFVRRAACLAIGALSGLCTTAALAGGNGNGGSGGGGAHGAATSGMTYHSEPVASPWNRPFGGDPSQVARQSQTETTTAMRRDTERAPETRQ